QEMFVAKGLRTLTMVDEKTMQELMEDEKIVKIYQTCIRKLAFKDRTRKEMYDYLTQKTDLNIKTINIMIEHLEARHYIDDLSYTNSAVTTLQSLLQGRHKITKSLRQKGIPQEMIDEVLRKDDQEEEINNALRYAEKIKATIKDTSVIAKHSQLSLKLFQQGYDRAVIDTVLASVSFTEDERNEVENCRKAALKAYKKYSLKYQKTALRNHVFSYLSTQGYPMETIYIALNEMEWKDE
ncbi:MAG: RecX family transcriptional regulator, partial [Erysipelotrichaceae bacterium]